MQTLTDNLSEVGLHVFERAGLGKAPYVFAGCETKIFKAHPDAPAQPGTSCDYCGTGIMQVFHLVSADNKHFKVGCDCINRTGDQGLIKAYKNAPEYRQRQRDMLRARQDAKIAEGKVLLERQDVREALAAEPHHIGDWKPNNTLLDTVQWYLSNAGRSGKTWAATKIIKSAQIINAQQRVQS